MPTYDYAAYDASGKLVDGVVSADSERHARRLLKEKITAIKASGSGKIYAKIQVGQVHKG